MFHHVTCRSEHFFFNSIVINAFRSTTTPINAFGSTAFFLGVALLAAAAETHLEATFGSHIAGCCSGAILEAILGAILGAILEAILEAILLGYILDLASRWRPSSIII